jgi:hypothetical protein
MFYQDINILLSRTSSTNDVFLLFARDFDLNTLKTIRVLMTSLKKRNIKNKSIENKRRKNIENNIKNEISESNESEKNYRSKKSHKSKRNHKNIESVRNRNQDN